MSDSRRPWRQKWWLWLVMAAAGLVLIGTSAGSPPTSGVGQDRLFSIASQLKCVQCVGESVASSQAPIAIQFRQEISEQMGRGQTNDEILNYFAARYDDVLLRPPTRGIGSLVWILPVVVVIGAVGMLGAAFRTWSLDRSERAATSAEHELVANALDHNGAAPPSAHVPADDPESDEP